jgi:zinc-ribbon domain
MPKTCSKCGTENGDEAKFCRACGAAFAPAEIPAPVTPAPVTQQPQVLAVPVASKPKGLQIALGVAVLIIVAVAAWWLGGSHAARAPSGDAVMPSSAARPAASAVAGPQSTITRDSPGSAAPAPAVEPPTPPAAVASAPSVPPSPALSPAPTGVASSSAARTDANSAMAGASSAQELADAAKAAREARAKALREQRQLAASQAGQQGARRRADDSHAPSPTTGQARANTVEEICTGTNPFSRSFCEVRECVKREHASEEVCRRSANDHSGQR